MNAGWPDKESSFYKHTTIQTEEQLSTLIQRTSDEESRSPSKRKKKNINDQ